MAESGGGAGPPSVEPAGGEDAAARPTRSLRPTRIGVTVRAAALAGVMLVGLWVVVSSGEPVVWLAITNVGTEVVEVRFNGERLIILQPGETQYFPAGPRSWSTQVLIEVYGFPYGARHARWWADLTDLANDHWQLRVS